MLTELKPTYKRTKVAKLTSLGADNSPGEDELIMVQIELADYGADFTLPTLLGAYRKALNVMADINIHHRGPGTPFTARKELIHRHVIGSTFTLLFIHSIGLDV